MSKMILEKNAGQRRNFVSPSVSTDHADATAKGAVLPGLGLNAKTGLGVVLGLWALRRFPKTTLLGAVALGIYAGMNRKQSGGKNPFQGEGIVKDFLH
jgi:hypothetical protein